MAPQCTDPRSPTPRLCKSLHCEWQVSPSPKANSRGAHSLFAAKRHTSRGERIRAKPPQAAAPTILSPRFSPKANSRGERIRAKPPQAAAPTILSPRFSPKANSRGERICEDPIFRRCFKRELWKPRGKRKPVATRRDARRPVVRVRWATGGPRCVHTARIGLKSRVQSRACNSTFLSNEFKELRELQCIRVVHRGGVVTNSVRSCRVRQRSFQTVRVE